MIGFIFSSFVTILGYFLVGKTYSNINFNTNKINTFEKLIYGFIIISFISVLINFFFPLNKFINTFFLFIIIVIFFLKKNTISKQEIFTLVFISLLTCMFIALDTINRPDGMIYHYPFSKILNEEKIILGISNIHFRFAHSSILQYSSSINNNYLLGDLGLVIPTASIYISILLYILRELYFSLKKKDFSLSKVFLVLVTFYISYKINRYSKIGNDDIGHLISFLIVYKFLNFKSFDINNFKYLSLLSVFAISNKFSLIIFSLFPLIMLINNKKYFIRIIFSLPSFFLVIWFFKNLLVSGCFLYPISQTCLESLSWTNTEVIEQQKISGEAWAKDWPNYIDQKSDMEDYVKNFKWLNTWSNNHLKIVLKNIIPLIFISILIILYNGKNYYRKPINIFDGKISYTILILLLGTIIFFLKFPLYRYGYSYLISIIALITVIFVDNKNKVKMLNISKYTIIFILIALPTKQLLRYYKFFGERPIVPQYTDINLKLKKINIDNNFNYYLNDESQYCWYNKPICTYYEVKNIKIEKFKSYIILSLKEK